MEFDIVLFVLRQEERKILDKIKKVRSLEKDEDALRLGLSLLEIATDGNDTPPKVTLTLGNATELTFKPGPAYEVKLAENLVPGLALKITNHIVNNLKINKTNPDAFNFKVVGMKKGGRFGSFGGGKGGTSIGP
jgi:hypothetical protein